MNPSLLLEYDCPFCRRAFHTVQARNAHKGKCGNNTTAKGKATRYEELMRINDLIEDRKDELKELYVMRDSLYQEIIRDFNQIKKLMEVQH